MRTAHAIFFYIFFCDANYGDLANAGLGLKGGGQPRRMRHICDIIVFTT